MGKTQNNTPEALTERKSGHYVPIHGLSMYYEVHGTGKPLVLLHGGPTTIDITFGALLPTLAKSWQVIAVEQQGHGHTADMDRPMSYAQMADDTAALLRHLNLEQVPIFGHSDGGNVGLGIAMQHPELVSKLIIAGTHFNNKGLVPGMLESFKTINPDDDNFRRLKEAYLTVAPKPEDWPTLVGKVMQMALDFPGWPPEDLKAIKAHTLVMIGDADVICPEHAVEMFRLIPQSQLAVLPGSDHSLTKKRADWVLPLISDFLNAPIPSAK